MHIPGFLVSVVDGLVTIGAVTDVAGKVPGTGGVVIEGFAVAGTDKAVPAPGGHDFRLVPAAGTGSGKLIAGGQLGAGSDLAGSGHFIAKVIHIGAGDLFAAGHPDVIGVT